MDFFKYIREELGIVLNAQQKDAVVADERRILLEACPGSGKTTTLVVRIAYLILCKNVVSTDILTLTFSRASAQDMEERFNRLFGCFLEQKIHFSTIHSFCYTFLSYCQRKRILMLPDLIEQQGGRKLMVLKDIYRQIHNEYLSDDEVAELSNEIGFVKNKLIVPSEFDSVFDEFQMIFQSYENYKRERNLMDFDDMLNMAYEILCNNKSLYESYGHFNFVHVDEVQDTSLVQHRIIAELSQNGNLFMVGDTDQSIYGFRGAEPEYIVHIDDHYTDSKIMKLEHNYRSTKKLVSLSNSFIKQNINRHEKNMFTENEEGKEPEVFLVKNTEEQVQKVIQLIDDDISEYNTAVLFRNNISGLPISYKLIERNIPFYIRENYKGFFRHYVVNDVFSFFQLASDLSDIDSFIKVYYKMGAPISGSDIKQIKNNFEGKKDIIKTLFIYYHNKKYMLEHIGRIKKALKKISRLDPPNALITIEKDLNYDNYLKRNSGCMNVFSTLKYFAEGTKTLSEFKTKLRTLKNGIDQSFARQDKGAVSLLTIHGSKGLEFDKVILIDLIEGEFPGENSVEALLTGDRREYEEEVRLFYVGVTRSKKEVYLLAPQTSAGKVAKPSRFINQYVKYDNSIGFGEGQIVIHKKFGKGTILNSNDDVVEIHFEKYGRRKLSLSVSVQAGLLKAE